MFYYYVDIVMPTDQEIITILNTVCYTHRSQKEVACHAIGPHGELLALSEGRGRVGKPQTENFIVDSAEINR